MTSKVGVALTVQFVLLTRVLSISCRVTQLAVSCRQVLAYEFVLLDLTTGGYDQEVIVLCAQVRCDL